MGGLSQGRPGRFNGRPMSTCGMAAPNPLRQMPRQAAGQCWGRHKWPELTGQLHFFVWISISEALTCGGLTLGDSLHRWEELQVQPEQKNELYFVQRQSLHSVSKVLVSFRNLVTLSTPQRFLPYPAIAHLVTAPTSRGAG